MRVLEFKHTFDSVLDDFETKKKDPKDIDLMVCWDLPDMRVRRGSFEYWYADKADLREIYAATHIWRDDNNSTDIPVISLKHVIALLLESDERSKGQAGIGVAVAEHLLSLDKAASL